jgi:hypothetical protein
MLITVSWKSCLQINTIFIPLMSLLFPDYVQRTIKKKQKFLLLISSVGIATRLLDGRPRNHGSIPYRDNTSLRDGVQIASGAQPAYQMTTVDYLYGDKTAGARC